jgi:predicted small secreted protein
MKMTVTVAALFAASLLAGGCNTVEGIGKDLSAAGGAITSPAKKDEKKAAPPPVQEPAKR